MPSALMWSPGMGAPETRQAKFAPRPFLVPALARDSSFRPMPPDLTVKRYPPDSTSGTTMDSLPFFEDSTKELASGR